MQESKTQQKLKHFLEVWYNMQVIDVKNLDYKAVNEALRKADKDCSIEGCCGQRFIAAGMSGKSLTINGIPGNALGAYLDNSNITVHANAQDAVGDTMNEGKILIHGNVGDAAGYAMHGGKMFLRGNCKDIRFPEQVTARCASDEDLAEIKEYLSEYCTDFGYSVDELLSAPFTIITPDSKNPYKQMYVAN